MTLAERFDLWAQQYEQKGIEKGIEQGIQQGVVQGLEKGLQQGILKGEALALQRFLAKRFGPVPADTLQIISSATLTQLETWLDRVVDAPSLDDVFRS